MKKLFVFACALVMFSSFAGQITELWSISDPGPDWFPTGYFEEEGEVKVNDSVRGAAFNPVTGNIIVASRETEEVKVLDGMTGNFIKDLTPPAGGYEGGHFTINKVAVTPSGRIVVCSLGIPTFSAEESQIIRFYIWDSENDSDPEVITVEGTSTRIGDQIAATALNNGDEMVIALTHNGDPDHQYVKLLFDGTDWTYELFSIDFPNIGSESSPSYPVIRNLDLHTDGSMATKHGTGVVYYFNAQGEHVETGTYQYGGSRTTLITNPFGEYIAAGNIAYYPARVLRFPNEPGNEAALYSPARTAETWMWVWNQEGEIVAYKNIGNLLSTVNGNSAGDFEFFEWNGSYYILAMATNNFIAVFELDPTDTVEPSPLPLDYADFDFGYSLSPSDMGFADNFDNLYLVDAAYNSLTDNLLVLDSARYGTGTNEGNMWNELVDPEDTTSIQILNREDGSVVGSIANLPFFDGWGGPCPSRITITEDGVILVLGRGGTVRKIGTEETTDAGSAFRVNDSYHLPGEEVVYGGTASLYTVGNYNTGNCYLITSRGNRIYVMKNSPANLDQFDRVTKFTAYGPQEASSPYIRGVAANDDMTQIITYYQGNPTAGGNNLRRFIGSPETGYAQDVNFEGKRNWSRSLDADFDGNFVVMSSGHTDHDARPDYDLPYTWIFFEEISTQENVFSGNYGTGHFEIKDTDMNEAGGGVVIDKVNGQVFAVNSSGLYQLVGDVSSISSAANWSIFE